MKRKNDSHIRWATRWMTTILPVYLFALLPLLASCSDDIFDHSKEGGSTGQVVISLADVGSDRLAGFEVTLRNTTTNSIFTSVTDNQGMALFTVTPGIYEACASKRQSETGMGYAYVFNGTSGQITISSGQTTMTSIRIKTARTSQIIIKELYSGGCMKDDGTTQFQYDKCVILYNNSSQPLSLSNLCLGAVTPANAQATNRNYDDDGKLVYEAEGFIPVWNGIWYFPQTLDIAPYQQVVVNIHGAIDNTQTVSQSVNYANSDYYCMYDPESGYVNTSYYPTPSDLIPSSHYLKAVVFGLGNAWPFSVSSPAMVLFQTKDIAPRDYANNTENLWYTGNAVSQVNACVKVPNEWILDAIEVYSSAYATSSVKRLTADIDAGYVWLTNFHGHSLYRNIDKAATEALPENEGRLVYDDGNADPCGIDAEASMSRGAHLIYSDTNNSTNDFHERQQCSLRK